MIGKFVVFSRMNYRLADDWNKSTSPYFLFRISSGFALMLAGLTYFFEKEPRKERRSFGLTLFSAGVLFVISALDPLLKIQIDLSNCIVAFWLYMLGKSFTDTVLFIFADERKPLSERFYRISNKIGIIWTVLVCLVPMMDYLLHLAPVSISVEDASALGPFHLAASLAVYGLPLQSCVFAIAGGYLRLVQLGSHSARARTMFMFFALLLANILAIFTFLAFSLMLPYRLAFTFLQILLIFMHFYVVAHPECLQQAQREVQQDRHAAKIWAENEAKRIEHELALLEDGPLLFETGCSLAKIAKKLNIPSYRLSAFFYDNLKTSYSVWINKIRIRRACKLLLTESDSSTLDVAFACGYGSKSAFNEQFKKVTGVNPREYKKTHQTEA